MSMLGSQLLTTVMHPQMTAVTCSVWNYMPMLTVARLAVKKNKRPQVCMKT